MTRTKPTLDRRDRIRHQAVAIAGLVLVWVLLWGQFTWMNLILGVLVATAILAFFPLPPVRFAGRLRPIGLLRFLVRFFIDLTVASVQVAVLAFKPGTPTSAIVAVRLRVRSDLNMTLVAEAVSLIPGSLITEADRHTGTLYIHMLGVTDRDHLERLRRSVLLLEARLLRTVGSDAELQLLNEAESDNGEERPS